MPAESPLPELIFVPALATLLHLTVSSTRRAIHRGECGPYFRIGRRLAIRRVAFMEALEARERHPEPRPLARPDPAAKSLTEALMKRTARL